MKSEEQVKKDLINKLKQQVSLLEKGDSESIISYKTLRQQIGVLEDVLELNTLNNAPGGVTEIFKNRRD